MQTVQLNTDEFLRKRVTTLSLFNWATHVLLAQELERTHTFTPTAPIKGNGVEQHFNEAKVDLTKTPLLKSICGELEDYLREAQILPSMVSFNSFMAQQYVPPLKVGIGIHSDGKRFDNVIAVIVIKAGGQFFISVDKEGTKQFFVHATIGDVIIFDNTIYHSVINVYSPRLTVEARFDLIPHRPL